MIEAKWLRGATAAAFLLVASAAHATSYTSNNTGGGDWSTASTWSPNGIPTTGDDVTIIGSDIVDVSDAQTALSVTLAGGSGSRTLRLVTGGTLTLDSALTALQVNASSDGTNLVEFDGGTLITSNGDVNVNAPALSLARINFTSTGGTLDIAGDLTFSGTVSNAQLKFDAGSAGMVVIGGDLGNGGSITQSTTSTFKFNGASSQTINSYTFQNLTIDKVSSTATLNGPITVDGDLTITDGVLDDGGNQITLNSGTSSSVIMGATGVLKLG
ncbi:MAG TPA: hypothetical protein VJZ00_12225, partial [Thermoanaerobaculia bacterium]|nr:hypothetical protein [Thermoanaerobaculia bacterium]